MSLRDQSEAREGGTPSSGQTFEESRTKTLFLVRHGESTFNKWRKRSFFTCTCLCSRWTAFDAPLTDAGKLQVSQLQERKNSLGVREVELVLTSPRVRAIDTTLGVFSDILGEVPVIATSMHAERLDNACDIGKPLSELRSLYPKIDFSGIAEEYWWYGGEENYKNPYVDEPMQVCLERVKKFKEWLRSRAETRIAVVGHAGFFRAFLHTRRKLENCEVLEVLFQ